MVGVDPDFQGRGIGAGLIAFAVDWMRQGGESTS
jgi:GNAT superfamily N-acetyltransferase